MKEQYQVPRVLAGYGGTFGVYSFLQINSDVLEAFAGDNKLVAFRTRNKNKEYGVLRYFELPNEYHTSQQIRSIRRVFYDDEHDEEHHWVFTYILGRREFM